LNKINNIKNNYSGHQRSNQDCQEPVQDLGQWMQCKAKVGEKAQHTGASEHFKPTFNAAMRHSKRS
jgi:hypothetical protein